MSGVGRPRVRWRRHGRGAPALALWCALLLASNTARGEAFPSRGGESGLLDTPSAEVVGRGAALFDFELRWVESPAEPGALSPSPLSIVAGLGLGLETGFFLRQSGRPGDPSPSALLAGTAFKYRLRSATGLIPAVAVDVVGDRLNTTPAGALRLILSTTRIGPLQVHGFGGVESSDIGAAKIGAVGGLAASARFKTLELAAQGQGGSQGSLVGAALRWEFFSGVGVGAGLDYLPKDDDLRFTVMFGFYSAPFNLRRPEPPRKADDRADAPRDPRLTKIDRPRFRLKLRRQGEDGPACRLHTAVRDGESRPVVLPKPTEPIVLTLKNVPDRSREIAEAAAQELQQGVNAAAQDSLGTAGASAVAQGVAGAPIIGPILRAPPVEQPMEVDFPVREGAMPETERAAIAQRGARASSAGSRLHVWIWGPSDVSVLPRLVEWGTDMKKSLLAQAGEPKPDVTIEISSGLGIDGMKAMVSSAEQRQKCSDKPFLAPSYCPKITPRLKVGPRGVSPQAFVTDAVAVPGGSLRSGDISAIIALAKRASAEANDLLIWARTGDDLKNFKQAAERAAQIHSALLQAGVPEEQIAIEISTMPNMHGLEVLVSSQRSDKSKYRR